MEHAKHEEFDTPAVVDEVPAGHDAHAWRSKGGVQLIGLGLFDCGFSFDNLTIRCDGDFLL